MTIPLKGIDLAAGLTEENSREIAELDRRMREALKPTAPIAPIIQLSDPPIIMNQFAGFEVSVENTFGLSLENSQGNVFVKLRPFLRILILTYRMFNFFCIRLISVHLFLYPQIFFSTKYSKNR